jgi:DNA-binding IclR family transcriptional regulator
MKAETLAALKAGVLLQQDDLRILIALSLGDPLTVSNLCELLGLKYADVNRRTSNLETLHFIVQVPIFLPEDAVRLGWTIAPSPGVEFALHALAETMDVETFTARSPR